MEAIRKLISENHPGYELSRIIEYSRSGRWFNVSAQKQNQRKVYSKIKKLGAAKMGVEIRCKTQGQVSKYIEITICTSNPTL